MTQELKLTVRQYRPSFFEGFKAEVHNVQTFAAITEIGFVKKFAETPGFLRFSVVRQNLVAEYKAGAIDREFHWLIVATFIGVTHQELLAYFPEWEKNRQ